MTAPLSWFRPSQRHQGASSASSDEPADDEVVRDRDDVTVALVRPAECVDRVIEPAAADVAFIERHALEEGVVSGRDVGAILRKRRAVVDHGVRNGRDAEPPADDPRSLHGPTLGAVDDLVRFEPGEASSGRERLSHTEWRKFGVGRLVVSRFAVSDQMQRRCHRAEAFHDQLPLRGSSTLGGE